jgi:cytochrome c-type biogenesis protein CcmH/NrfF
MKACDATTPYYATYKQLISQLRCPVCGGQRIDSSQAAFAEAVKRDSCDYVQAAMSQSEIIAKLEQDYGQSLQIHTAADNATWPITAILLAIALIVALKIKHNSIN